MGAWTTADLISSVRARGMFPDASTGSYSDANMLRYANGELYGKLVPAVLGVREKYYETYLDYDVTASQSSYAIPVRAIGGALSAVQYVNNKQVYHLNPIDPSQVVSITNSLIPRGFYFQNNNVVIYPTPNATVGTLRLRYFQRPNKLEQTTNCAQISTISTGTNEVVVSSIPATWTTATVIDFIPATFPYTVLSADKAIAGVSSTTVSFAALPTGLAVGDWLALAEYTPIPEIPIEFQQLLVAMTLVKALQAAGDQQNYVIAKAELDEAKSDAIKLISPRDQLGLKKVCSLWRNW